MAGLVARLVAFGVALCGWCAAAAAAGPSAASPVDTISYVVTIWGREMYEWVIRADGSGELRSLDDSDPGDSNDPNFLVKRFQADAATFERVRAALLLPESYAGRGVACTAGPPDGPYGRVRWSDRGHGRELNRIFSCQSDEATRVDDAIGAADEIVGPRVGSQSGERHRRSELPDIHPAEIIRGTGGEAQ